MYVYILMCDDVHMCMYAYAYAYAYACVHYEPGTYMYMH